MAEKAVGRSKRCGPAADAKTLAKWKIEADEARKYGISVEFQGRGSIYQRLLIKLREEHTNRNISPFFRNEDPKKRFMYTFIVNLPEGKYIANVSTSIPFVNNDDIIRNFYMERRGNKEDTTKGFGNGNKDADKSVCAENPLSFEKIVMCLPEDHAPKDYKNLSKFKCMVLGHTDPNNPHKMLIEEDRKHKRFKEFVEVLNSIEFTSKTGGDQKRIEDATTFTFTKVAVSNFSWKKKDCMILPLICEVPDDSECEIYNIEKPLIYGQKNEITGRVRTKILSSNVAENKFFMEEEDKVFSFDTTFKDIKKHDGGNKNYRKTEIDCNITVRIKKPGIHGEGYQGSGQKNNKIEKTLGGGRLYNRIYGHTLANQRFTSDPCYIFGNRFSSELVKIMGNMPNTFDYDPKTQTQSVLNIEDVVYVDFLIEDARTTEYIDNKPVNFHDHNMAVVKIGCDFYTTEENSEINNLMKKAVSSVFENKQCSKTVERMVEYFKKNHSKREKCKYLEIDVVDDDEITKYQAYNALTGEPFNYNKKEDQKLLTPFGKKKTILTYFMNKEDNEDCVKGIRNIFDDSKESEKNIAEFSNVNFQELSRREAKQAGVLDFILKQGRKVFRIEVPQAKVIKNWKNNNKAEEVNSKDIKTIRNTTEYLNVIETMSDVLVVPGPSSTFIRNDISKSKDKIRIKWNVPNKPKSNPSGKKDRKARDKFRKGLPYYTDQGNPLTPLRYDGAKQRIEFNMAFPVNNLILTSDFSKKQEVGKEYLKSLIQGMERGAMYSVGFVKYPVQLPDTRLEIEEEVIEHKIRREYLATLKNQTLPFIENNENLYRKIKSEEIENMMKVIDKSMKKFRSAK